MDIYDRDGQPMSFEAFTAVPYKKRVIKRTTLILGGEPVSVLTMWDGKDMADGEAPWPCPFSTFISSESYPNMLMAVPSEERARVSHEMMVGFVRAQGGRRGWRLPLHFVRSAYADPVSVKTGWIMMLVAAVIVAVQLSSLTFSVLAGRLWWPDLLSAAILALYGWLFLCSLQGLKRRLEERREERRVKKDREAFEEIVGQVK